MTLAPAPSRPSRRRAGPPNRRVLGGLAVLGVLGVLASGCGSDDPPPGGEETGDDAVAAREAGCPTSFGESRVVPTGLDAYSLAVVDDAVVYADEEGVVVDRGDTPATLEVDVPDPKVVGEVDGDVIVTSRGTGAGQVVRVTLEGEEVWRADSPEVSTIDVAFPFSVVDGGTDTWLDAATGEPTDPGAAESTGSVLSYEGADLLGLGAEGSSSLLVWGVGEDDLAVVTESDRSDPVEVPEGNAAVCGRVVYGFDFDAGELAVYEKDGGELTEVERVELSEAPSQTLFQVRGTAAVFTAGSGALVLTP